MNSKERAKLRGMANNLQPIFQVGKNGLADNFFKQVDEALEARELIKITVLDTATDAAKEIAESISKEVNAEVVQVIGSKITFYRQSKKPVISLD